MDEEIRIPCVIVPVEVAQRRGLKLGDPVMHDGQEYRLRFFDIPLLAFIGYPVDGAQTEPSRG